MYNIELEDPASPAAQALLEALSASLDRITGSSGKASFDPADVRGEKACFVLARGADGTPLGCGALRPLQADIAEVKRMFAVPGSAGVGSAVLACLEHQARLFGYKQLWLETRKVNARAVAFYERHGYVVIPNFGKYVGRPEAVCFGKLLAASHGTQSAGDT